MFADDVTLWCTGENVNDLNTQISSDLAEVEKYCEKWKLAINVNKTVYQLFTQGHLAAKVPIELSVLEAETRHQPPVPRS